MNAAATTTAPSDGGEASLPRTPDARGARIALATFIGVEVVAAALFVWYGRKQWFYWDEWELLAGRSATSLNDFLVPWHGHWVGGATLIYRGLFNVFGLNTYLPYQLLAVAVHLAVAALLRVVMRRAGVGPWIATAAAGSFALFGTGKQNIVWGFQITFTAAVMLGLVHLLLADHEGGLGWRDALGILAGLAALTFSGAGVVMIGVVGLAVLVRRGFVAAAVHVVPLGVCFAAWWLAYGKDTDYAGERSQLGTVARYTVGGFEATLHALGQLSATSYLLAAIFVVGLALSWRHIGTRAVRQRAAEPAALLLGGLLFLALTGWSRGWAMEALTGSLTYPGRYVHVAAAMLLPAFAVAADALARRWRPLGVVVLLPLLVGVPGNVYEIADRDRFETQELGNPDLFLAVANSPLVAEVPGTVQPFPENEQGSITTEWIRDAVASGRIPTSGEVRADFARGAELRLSIEQTDAPLVTENCVRGAQPQTRRLEVGQSIGFTTLVRGSIRVVSRLPGASQFSSIMYTPLDGETLTVVAGPLDVLIEPVGSMTICG